ncbi:hypothetical protein [Lacipirellula parvula]|uniref:Carboxypeptidase regulatory-like domain-containing protein n=1 Tax=Lacipirellula parvula TaxID=2650471 RepID=A0A5K7XD37_9BACT|nr:hypothetical protein [Lacipirellula parvula]BBO34378.1 hypothetical protein PLANPX_3990 [Lacipirellula parvula]
MNLECCKTKCVSRPGRRHGVGLLGVAIALMAMAGCGEAKPQRTAVFPAKGTITLKGEPAHGAIIALHPKSPLPAGVPAPRANVDKDGSFAVSTYDSGDGAPEGEYVLTVVWNKLIKNGGDVRIGPNVIPTKYGNPTSSDLVVKVTAGENAIPAIQL